MAVGIVGASVTYGVDWHRTGKMDWSGYGETLAWTVGGGMVAGGLTKFIGGAPTWGAAFFKENAISKVRVPAYRTKMGYGTGPGGGRKGWVGKEIVDIPGTAVNVGINSQLSYGFCGAGSASALYGRSCP